MRSARRGSPGAWPVFLTGGTGAHPGMPVAVGGVRLEPLPVRTALCTLPEDTRDRRWPTSASHSGLRRSGPPPISPHSAPCDGVCGARVGAGHGESIAAGTDSGAGVHGDGIDVGGEDRRPHRWGERWSCMKRWRTAVVVDRASTEVSRWLEPELGVPRCATCRRRCGRASGSGPVVCGSPLVAHQDSRRTFELGHALAQIARVAEHVAKSARESAVWREYGGDAVEGGSQEKGRPPLRRPP